MKKFLLSSALAMILGSPTYAQESSAIPTELQSETIKTTEPKAPFEAEMKYLGEINGAQTWSVPGDDFLVSEAPNGNVYVGYVFDKSGKDLGSGLAGFDPLRIEDVLSSNNATAPVVEQGLPELEPQPELEENDEDILAKAPTAVRNELLARLIERIENVKTKEEYQKTIEEWRNEVRTTLAKDDESITSQEMESIKSQIEAMMGNVEMETQIPVESKTQSEANPSDAVPSQEDAESEQDADLSELNETTPAIKTFDMNGTTLAMGSGKVGGEELSNKQEATKTENTQEPQATKPVVKNIEEERFKVLTEQSHFFSVGNKEAPNVYMVVDPTCPYCSRSLVALKEEVAAGKIRLNVIPAALLSKRSEEVLSGIMSSQNPAITLFDNASANTGGEGKAVEPKNYGDLAQDVREMLENNRKNIINLGISQIPYFAWEENNVKKGHLGVYEPGLFNNIMKE